MKLPRLLSAVLAVCLIFAPGANARTAPAVEAPIIDFGSRFLPVVARQGMVVGPERLAAEIGLGILEQGGNAVDAAVATGFALAVSYPRAGNLAGGGFMLVHLAEGNRQTLIDYRETAPASAGRDLFLNEAGEVDRERTYFSHQAAGVPGTVAGLVLAQARYGTLPLKQVMAPAIALAEDGLQVSFALNLEINSRAERLALNPEARKLFLTPEGEAPEVGATWRQPELAWTLRQIAEQGHKGFYQGEVAARLVAEMEAGNGLITAADLAGYQALEREPVRGSFQGAEIVSTPPPSSGGVHIIQMLNMLEGFDLAAMGHNSAAYIHHLAEAMKLAYADRSKYLADSDFEPVPVAKLIGKDYAARQRNLIDPARATPATEIAPGRVLVDESHDTTHYTVADRFGNVVSNTYTLNFSFGSHIAVPGTGMLLNNEMADFAANPGQPNAYGLVESDANRIEGGKRPLSSMSPTMVFRDGKPWLATGSPGGSLIITAVLQTVLNATVFDMNIATAAAEARVHHQWQPDKLVVEQGISPDTLQLLQAMGHNVDVAPRTLGRTQSIMLERGYLLGATDTRRLGGHVAAY
ncbi:gamma-glutamyltransferase [Haliea sp. E1-2-M8]|uniref:gamma-glutamyltransferase n=1 Tax=Haliea sp. E1-2-M8 TaxID=3064706 RepID=UPI00271A8176|nr:gamma-glutamyltransferase [Haliea sp. E1-2-M8]MDO8862633.1 gamma-glutamyltransferase [Haliea sp. E1-2-M8]